VFKLDHDGDGVVEPAAGDRVVLYFGMRRGGRSYYAVDVTAVNPDGDPAGDAPKLLWIAGPTDDVAIPADRRLPLVGQTWSRPVVTRMKVPGHAGSDDWVVMFAGGYDPQQDPPDGKPRPYADDAIGTGLYVLDAFTGRLLWRAGPDGAADLTLAGMTASIPADLNALDLTGDGYVDLAYVGDLRGRVWRIDFSQAAKSVAGMATGGVFADLGGAGVAGARRFFASPDVSLVSRQGASWLTVAIGSGHRELPLSDGCTPLNIALKYGGDADACLETDDRFYALRDHAPLAPKDWSAPQAGPVTEADLVDVTPAVGAGGEQAAVPGGSAGWMLRLDSDPGEKAISPSRTFDHTVFIPTFVPLEREPEGDAAACTQAIGYNNLYQVSVLDARPGQHLGQSGHEVVASGLAIRLGQAGIAPEPVFLFPATPAAPADGGPAGDAAPPAPERPPPVCLVGAESCGSLAGVAPRRTYWRKQGSE
jgi:type IV pilus assembly protein PilY1